MIDQCVQTLQLPPPGCLQTEPAYLQTPPGYSVHSPPEPQEILCVQVPIVSLVSEISSFSHLPKTGFQDQAMVDIARQTFYH